MDFIIIPFCLFLCSSESLQVAHRLWVISFARRPFLSSSTVSCFIITLCLMEINFITFRGDGRKWTRNSRLGQDLQIVEQKNYPESPSPFRQNNQHMMTLTKPDHHCAIVYLTVHTTWPPTSSSSSSTVHWTDKSLFPSSSLCVSASQTLGEVLNLPVDSCNVFFIQFLIYFSSPFRRSVLIIKTTTKLVRKVIIILKVSFLCFSLLLSDDEWREPGETFVDSPGCLQTVG